MDSFPSWQGESDPRTSRLGPLGSSGVVHTAGVSDLSGAIDDDIVVRRILPAIIKIRGLLGCGIPAALDDFRQRYDRLRVERADEFMSRARSTGMASTRDTWLRRVRIEGADCQRASSPSPMGNGQR